MFDILFSFSFVWITVLTIILATAIAYFCIFLHQQFLYISAAEWLAEHIYCPTLRVLLLMFMAFLLFPLMIENTGYSQLFQLFFQPDFLINMVNILFLSSLIFSFITILNQSVTAMPILSCIATGLFYQHQIAIPAQVEFSWIPTGSAFGKIVVWMILTYMLSRWLSETISEWIDLRFMVTESKNLVTDISYLVLQMPVILAYGQSLAIQATTT
ncbi:MAG: hypothetical protein HOM14_19565 [Gammaproteobacteria bacterium]|jgi:hypothetical protein|nr:hypothetical protein [Gammaproteobacteria bacterium]MBT3721881.1 hypothetical protein [Gammaproteobacteria bacterium]MBT4076664.1 hypothetical protein [Gammaproteobacteria bacterium]MBT4196914.1 hypothetical protein [Gammaproteobacteria bacterium]MBT4451370.1 hypothetical protein [Gammaproteobacteria bacterium]